MKKKSEFLYLHQLHTIVQFLYIIVVAFGLLITSYLGLNYSESISAVVDDDWCSSKLEGVGIHCFSDFYQISQFSKLDIPWLNGTPYTPISIFIMKIISNDFFISISIKLPLFINQILLIGCIIFPFIYHWKNLNTTEKYSNKFLLIIIGFSTPVLMTFDRGNSVYLLFPFMYFIFKGFLSENYMQVAMLIGLAGIIRPQMMMLVLIFLPMINWKAVIISLGTFMVGLLASFLLFPGNLFSNAARWLQNISSYQTYTDIPSLRNYSFANFIGLLKGSFEVMLQNKQLAEAFRPPISSNYVTIISVIFLSISVVWILILRNKLTRFEILFICSLVTILTPGTSFGYYLILLVVPMMFLTIDYSNNSSKIHFTMINNVVFRAHFYLLYLALVPPWPFQWGMFDLQVKDVWSNYGVSGTVVSVVLALLPLNFFITKQYILSREKKKMYREAL
jgi:hypothetical protein